MIRIFSAVSLLLSRSELSYRLLRKVCNIKVVFLCYPEEKRFTNNFLYSWLHKYAKSPFVIGYFRQNGNLGLTFAINLENGLKELMTMGKGGKLAEIYQRMEDVCVFAGADKVALAGSIPSVCSRFKIDIPKVDTTVTPWAVSLAVLATKKMLTISECELIMIGVSGFVGVRVRKHLFDLFPDYYGVTLENKETFSRELARNTKPIIILNISEKGAIQSYLSEMILCSQQRKIIILDEVYPGIINPLDLQMMDEVGISYVRIIGVLADQVVPPFPGEYNRGGFVFPMTDRNSREISDYLVCDGYHWAEAPVIPCCAASDSDNLRVVIRLMTEN